ncbi:MAG: DUF4886 domain-containing protein [Kiritimatiellae bacterium]|nr:DUF4886 domain-containing protein [Kiritimatiellia bacterium]
MKLTSLLIAVLAVLSAGLCHGQSPAPADKPPLRVLAIGNSFSASLCRYLPAMAAAAGEKLEFCNLFIGGCSLRRHADNIAKAGADPSFAPYEVTWFLPGEAAPAKFRSNVPQMLATQKWDVVTLQQASHESWKPGSFHPWADSVIATVRSLAPDAEIVVHETWSYNAADARIGGKFPDWPFDQAGMYSRLETNYLALARENGLRVIPVGLAVQKRRAALAARGGVFDPATLSPGDPFDLKGEPVGALHWKDGKISGDTIHLNKAGEYMQAMTWLGFLFDRDVRDIGFAPAAAGDAETCAALRAAAQDALDEAKARGWQDFAPKKARPPVWRAKRTTDDAMDRLLPDPNTAAFVSVTNGVVDAGTTSPLDDKDLCYWFDCSYDDDSLCVSVVVFDDDRQSDSCAEGSVSCPAWDDDAVEIFLDGEFARLPDSRADGGVHLTHGGEFTLVANGAAMSDFSGYPKTFIPLEDLARLKAAQDSTNVWWTGVVLPVISGPGERVPNALLYNFVIPWRAMGRTDKPDRIGFNVGVQDDDGGGRRNHALYWTGNPARPFSDESAFGILEFEP